MIEAFQMTKKEIIDEISLMYTQVEDDPTLALEEEFMNRMHDLDYALTHNFPHMIGGKQSTIEDSDRRAYLRGQQNQYFD